MLFSGRFRFSLPQLFSGRFRFSLLMLFSGRFHRLLLPSFWFHLRLQTGHFSARTYLRPPGLTVLSETMSASFFLPNSSWLYFFPFPCNSSAFYFLYKRSSFRFQIFPKNSDILRKKLACELLRLRRVASAAKFSSNPWRSPQSVFMS